MDLQKENHKHHRRRRRANPSSWIAPIMNQNRHVPSLIRDLKLVTITSLMLLLTLIPHIVLTQTNQAPSLSPFQSAYLLPGYSMENLRIPETQPVFSVVHTLKAKDSNSGKITYALTGDTFSVDEETGEVRLMRQLDREKQPQISTVVNVLANNLDQPLESRRRTIIIEDADDSWPIFGQHKFSLVNNAPQGQYIYQVEISEQTPNGSLILSELPVTDADEGINADIIFECRASQSTNNACSVFAIESRRLNAGRYSVSLRTKAQLDFERVQLFKLSLVARGRRPSPLKGVPLEAEAIINIQLLNVQDEPPMFVNAPYALSMHEGLKPGSRLLSLTVQDGDAAPQRELSMIVVDGPFKNFFQVTKDPELSSVWYLETNQTIDRESLPVSSAQGNMFNISLLAAELDESSSSPTPSESELYAAVHDAWNYPKNTLKRENVTVVVLDLPDSRPVFLHASLGKPVEKNFLVVNVSESLVDGATISNLDLAAQDLDQGINARFKLALLDAEVGPQASAALALESDTVHGRAEVLLNVINATLLDYENPAFRTYRFSLVATKSAGNQLLTRGGQYQQQQADQLQLIQQPLVQILEIQMNIIDANDNFPEFDREQYIVSVPEGSPPNYLIATIKAKDRDSGLFGRVEYALRGSGASKFKLYPTEGKIVVNDCGVPHCLDYETQPSFSLTYEARDGGGQTRNVSVIIQVLDVNDHGPKFTESVYKRELISDNLSSKQNYISPQLIVKARDADGPTQGRNNITYQILWTNLTGLDVDPSSGLVYLSQPLDLDSLISESGDATTNLAGSSNYSSNSKNSVRQRPHWSDRKIVFEAEVLAQDNGQPPMNSSATIILTVKGNRDGAPMFKQDTYLAYARENQPIGKPFYQVQAVDPDDKDSQLRYSLGYDLNDLLQIHEQTGELSFKEMVDYDNFKGQPYNISVYATDSSRPQPLRATAVVSILIQDVNDKRPRFESSEYKASLVQGKTKPGDMILQVRAIDLDKNHHLSYSIVHESLALSDRNGQQFTLDDVANATSGYLSQMSRVERNQLVQNLRNMFSVKRETGAIELKSEPDYSFAASISFQIKVVDLNQEIFTSGGELQQDLALCNMFLQTHIDKNPIFAPPWSIAKRDYELSILEELPHNTQIFSLLARDPQTQQRIEIFEKIFESDPRDYFRVERSGLVLVNRRIDYEELPQPKLLTVSVKALTSDALYSVANLHINIIDLNDNAPQFQNQSYRVSASEALQPLQEILTVQANDEDSDEFGQVHYSLAGYQSDLFQIHPRKGSISLKKNAKLDRETEPNYYLMVTASDCNETLRYQDQLTMANSLQQTLSSAPSCKKSTVPLEITVTDENDNDPVFINLNRRGELEVITSETVSINSIIAQVEARDFDEGPNGQVNYEIVNSDDQINQMFKIDPRGFISTQASLSGLGRAQPYKINLRAYDSGAKSNRQAYATLSLTIQDVVSNDGIPRFIRPRPEEVVLLSESTGPSTFVYQVQAIDLDEEANGKLMYKFIQPSDTFDIDPFDGVIKTQNKNGFYLDREQTPNYTLIVVAQDFGHPPKQAHQVLIVRITDVNDNEPYFGREIDDPPIVLDVEEEIPIDSLVGSIQAIDKDEGQNALIGYEILEGNQNNLFRLSWDPAENSSSSPTSVFSGNNLCKIYTTGRLNREMKDSYTLTIKASSMARVRNHLIPAHLRDPLGGRNLFNHYNASDLTKIRVTIKLIDINDNRPTFLDSNPKSIVDSSAEVYSQLMVIKAQDADQSSFPIQYSILDALYYSDSKLNQLRLKYEPKTGSRDGDYGDSMTGAQVSMKHVFDIDTNSGILRNAISLRPYTDGYFEVFIKADSGQYEVQSLSNSMRLLDSDRIIVSSSGKCKQSDRQTNFTLPPGSDVKENCHIAVTKAVVFVTHQRETFRLIFNKTKLNDRLDEFRYRVQQGLEDLMFESVQAQASLGGPERSPATTSSSPSSRAERVFINTFHTDFYEREDGSLDFSTITACSQLVRFDDRNNNGKIAASNSFNPSQDQEANPQFVPNQIVNYEEVITLLKTLNATQARQHQQSSPYNNNKLTSLFSQYGLVKIERCLPDKTMYKMTLAERLALYFAILIALVSILLAFIVSRMRKSYEKNLKILQRSKYHYGMPTTAAASPFGG